MSTLTLLRQPPKLIATLSHDEPPHAPRVDPPPPAVADPGRPVYWAGPTDGGSDVWMGANAAGIVGCVLPRGDFRDRTSGATIAGPGQVLPYILELESVEQILESLRARLFEKPISPFTLALFSPHSALEVVYTAAPRVAVTPLPWDWAMITTAPKENAHIMQYRAKQFERWVSDGAPYTGRLPSYHVERPVGAENLCAFPQAPDGKVRQIFQAIANYDAGYIEILHWTRPDVEHRQPSQSVIIDLGRRQFSLAYAPEGLSLRQGLAQ